jgi:hypothetical protein
MKFNFFLKTFLAFFIIVLVASCDKDINEIGSGIVGNEHFGMDVANRDVVAYSQNLGPVQTNNLTINQLGCYNNPVFGKTKASFVTQVALASANPKFYGDPNETNTVSPNYIKIDSVYLYVPYFSTFESTDDTGDSTYALDSLKGSDKIKLSVYESTKSLETLDPTTGFQQQQKYYSNQQPEFDANHGTIKLNNDDKNIDPKITTVDNSQNDEFVFSKKQIKFYKNNADGTPGTTDVAERKAPGMFLNLDKVFFKNKIVKASTANLYNNDAFKLHFKGLYFKAENASSAPNGSSLAMMNFSSGVITIVYKEKTSDTDVAIIRKTLKINLSGNTVNLLNNENTFPGYVTPNPATGDRNLFLKGGDGSMAVIDLFKQVDNYRYDKVTGVKSYVPNNIPDELDDLRFPEPGQQKWLINEANLTFFIAKSTMANAPEPNRIFLYDLNNKRPLIDYYADYSTASIYKYSKFIHGGILLDQNGKIVNAKIGEKGTTYKVNITNHIRNLIKYGGVGVTKDSTNVRLGLVVTENFSNAFNAYLNSPFTSGSGTNSVLSKYIPVMSVVNPLGTVLYGSNIPVGDPDYNKRIKLEIFYTKPD